MAKKSKTPVSEQVEAQLADAATLTIEQAAVISGLSGQYIRKAIREGKLQTLKVPVTEGSANWRHEILTASFHAWRETSGSHTSREDGRNKFVLYMDEAELDRLAKMIVGEPFAATLKRANIKTAAVAVPDEA